MKDSPEKENRISNLKNMFDHMNDEEIEEKLEIDEYDDIEEDEELIQFLNENQEDYEIDDEYIYHPGKDSHDAINLEDEAEIDENFIIETDINEKIDGQSQVINEHSDFEDTINDNFDNMVNMKIGEKPILAIISLILGIIFIVASVVVYNAGTDRIVDNVVSGENNFLVVFLIIIGALLIIYGLFKLLNVKNPFESMFESMNDDEEKQKLKKVENKQETPTIPKSNIPLDKESYKIGEFDMDELKSNLKNSFSKTVKKPEKPSNPEPEEIDVENLPPAREKSPDNKGLIKEEIEEKDYEQAQLDGESIDDIFADVEDLKENKE
ncbi:MAG: topoisomerase IV [Methanobrevibacter millerae]|uniref:Topoisomerase IV n=1 Tax=Methanobrevibacter millerae TaxID=230361 RepID=A0A8T3VI79_9EURY|nr:topoisomerase IV [Methanobrevibacter millerae]MBE6505826.1 topoisomerase IV [Methanobrevibacter millerae]